MIRLFSVIVGNEVTKRNVGSNYERPNLKSVWNDTFIVYTVLPFSVGEFMIRIYYNTVKKDIIDNDDWRNS